MINAQTLWKRLLVALGCPGTAKAPKPSRGYAACFW
jgi:hypothetical protein